MAGHVVRIAAVGDLHCTRTSQGAFHSLFTRAADTADVLLLAGDLTDYGSPDEARVLAKELSTIRIPVVGILGNHDFECGKQIETRQVLIDAGVTMLDGDAIEVNGVGIAGVKGFGGGFGKHALGPWGETMIKEFVREAVDEALKLEKALARLRTDRMIALMHYSPVQATVEGEPREIFPFLGSSRLEEPINRYPVSLVLHGHAHRGCAEGRTGREVPVYNVSMALLARTFPERPPFRLFEVEGSAPRAGETQPAHSVPANPPAGEASPQLVAAGQPGGRGEPSPAA